MHEEADDGEEELIPEETERAEPELLEELEAGVENAAEALVTMREARSKINEMKRDRGYGKSTLFWRQRVQATWKPSQPSKVDYDLLRLWTSRTLEG